MAHKRQCQVLWLLLYALLAGVCSAAPLREGDLQSLASQYVPKLEKNLKENIAAFWYSKCLDRKNGGYMISFGPHGEARGESTKGIVTQARTLWLFSRMARAGYDERDYLEAATLGYSFLKEKLWDSTYGGFYWEVDATGARQVRPLKHLYGQAFALYALSEYYLASHNREALDFAIQLFQLLESKAHDRAHGGYVEFFGRDWGPVPTGAENYMDKTSPDFKLMNTHLHLMEAMTTFYRASHLPLAKERLLELIMIQSNSVVRKSLGACTDKYDPNWNPRLEGEYSRVSYGHDLENIWLLADACDAVGLPNSLLLDLYRSLFDYSLKYGYDSQNGGFYYYGKWNQPAENKDKSWWVQAEAIVSALTMYRLTRDPKYLPVFEKTYQFIENHQVDWRYGEWYENVAPSGQPRPGNKAHLWKAGYHNGRAMMECLAILQAQDR